MKAVILAGGRGERLRPITDTRPKPLVPVLARPVMDYCLSLLSHHGVQKAYITTHYLAHLIRERYGENAYGMELFYSLEKTPLGTAGGVKMLEEELKDEECFPILSGDALCDFNLTEAIRFHRKKDADVTVILSSVRTPMEYGVVLQDTLEKIFAFSEKPDWSETLSDQVNTGVYILSPRVLKQIPREKVFDFSHDLFPLLLREGYSLYGYKDEGYWCDIGKISTLYRCNRDLLDGKAKIYLPQQGKRVSATDGKGLCFIADEAVVEKGAEIRSGSVIGAGATLRKGSTVDGALIMEDVGLEEGARAHSAILCERVHLEEGAVALNGSVLGAGTRLEKGVVAEAGALYPPGSHLKKKDPFTESEWCFTEDGVRFGSQKGLSPQETERLGLALGKEGNVGILWDEEEKESRYFALIASGGVIRGGSNAHLLGAGIEAMASFAAFRGGTRVIFVSGKEGKSRITVWEEDGFPLTRKATLRLSRLLREETPGEKIGLVLHRENTQEEYEAALSRVMGEGYRLSVGIEGKKQKWLRNAAIKSGFCAYDGMGEKGYSLKLFPSELKLYLEGNRLLDTENARLFVLDEKCRRGRREFALPSNAPEAMAERVRKYGGRAETFSMGHSLREESRSRKLAMRDRFLYDSNFLAAELFRMMASSEKEVFREKVASFPKIYVTRLNYFPEREHQAKLLGMLNGNKEQDEREIRIESGFYGMKIISEAFSAEAAVEHAFQYRGKIYEMEKELRGRK